MTTESSPAAPAAYQDALEFLFARTTGGFKFGLERTVALLEHLGHPERRYPSFHIAGTNGKGSTVATIAIVLAARGRRVATYTSPHLVDFRERMIVGGEPISTAEVSRFIADHIAYIEEIGASFFEATTAMAFDHFARAGTDVAVIEAGLGGRLDSTNVLTPLVAGVTSIGLDHTEYLGTTLEEIAAEKAGIFKRGRPAVIGERDPHIRALLADRAHAAGATPVRIAAEEIAIEDVEVSELGTTCAMRWKGEWATLSTPLAGEHQAANLAFALLMLDAAGPEYALKFEEAARLLPAVRIPGRFEQVGRFIFDVAHNPAGADVVARTIRAVQPREPITVILCVLRDKDWREMIRALAGVASRFVLTMAPTAPASRAWDLDEALAFSHSMGLSACAIADFGAALEIAQSAQGSVLVTGSFHTVGDAMARLGVSPLAPKVSPSAQ
jgi:dihydrofolate synthase / folylpolyglutamate synthase